MFILNPEERPHASTEDFGQTDEERHQSRVLYIVGENGVEDPGEAEDYVQDHSRVVRPRALEACDFPQREGGRVEGQERKVHKEVPECCSMLVYVAFAKELAVCAGHGTGSLQQ